MMCVPDRSHYDVAYVRGARLHSFTHQMATVLGLEPSSMLEVGVGSRFVTESLRSLGISVTTLDIEPSLEPDLLGSVSDIPAGDDEFELSLCCQVLEHLPFDDFHQALEELRRVTRRALVLSLPDVTRQVNAEISLPLVGRHRVSLDLTLFSRGEMGAERTEQLGHQWEIGYRGSSLSRVRSIMGEAGWELAREWRVPEVPWHHFFLLHGAEAGGDDKGGNH